MRGKSGYRSIKSAAEELGVSQVTIRRGIAAGHIPAVHVHGNWRIPGSYFDALEQEAYAKVMLPAPGGLPMIKRENPRGGTSPRAPIGWKSAQTETTVRIVRAVPS